MRVRLLALTAVAAFAAACSDSPLAPSAADATLESRDADLFSHGRTARVRNANDAGAGSFRAALAEANADTRVKEIRFDRGIGTIAALSALEYTGAQDLTITGNGARIDGAGLTGQTNGLTMSTAGDVTLKDLTFANAPGAGIAILIPSTATGTIEISLLDVTAKGNSLHGAIINDQTGYLADPLSTSPDGSAASLKVVSIGSSFTDNGFGQIDEDGLRVNEGGDGNLVALIAGNSVLRNGGDGIELDERGAGNADFAVSFTELLENGAFTAEDFDDGIDVDEAGDGDLRGSFIHVKANRNYEQGVDLNENDAGDLRVAMLNVEGSDNAEEGIEFEEDDDFAGGGDLIAELVAVRANGNGANDGDAGLKLREKGDGNLRARITGAVASGNEVGGVFVREDAEGNLDAVLTGIVASSNGDDGITFDENGNGNLVGSLSNSKANDNAAAGVHAEQQAAGTGALTVRRLTATGNPDGGVEANPAQVTVTTIP